MRTAATLFSGLLALACHASSPAGPHSASGGHAPSAAALAPDLAVARAPYDSVQVDWKQRLDQPYVYVEARGSYTRVGQALQQAFEALRDQSLEASGPPFALYYDDPGRVSADELRLRACFPVATPLQPRPPLAFDLLPSTTVVYAYVSGPYPDVPRAYPSLYAFLGKLEWLEDGPVREIYLVDPATAASWDELVTEIQIPARSGL
jgi:effector-binding domain-containing protein